MKRNKFGKAVAVLFATALISGAPAMVSSAQTYSVNALINGPTFRNHTVDIYQQAHFYGSALCESGNVFGNHCIWMGKLYGELAPAATNAKLSFGHDGSTNNNMTEVRMTSLVGPSYEITKTANAFTYYKKVTTFMRW